MKKATRKLYLKDGRVSFFRPSEPAEKAFLQGEILTPETLAEFHALQLTEKAQLHIIQCGLHWAQTSALNLKAVKLSGESHSLRVSPEVLAVYEELEKKL